MRERLFSLTKKDFEVQTSRGSGAGGQNRNKRDTKVRIIHKASGAVGESQEERSQEQNKKTALKRLTETKLFKAWLARAVHELNTGETVEQRVDRLMNEANIKVEVKDESNKWISTADL